MEIVRFIARASLPVLFTMLAGCVMNLLMLILAVIDMAHEPPSYWDGERFYMPDYDMDAIEYLRMLDIWYPCPDCEHLFNHEMT